MRSIGVYAVDYIARLCALPTRLRSTIETEPSWPLACNPGGMRCALLLGLSTLLIAQQSRFEVRSPLVVVPVSVTDGKGRFVSDLEASDFLVFDNGRAQKAVPGYHRMEVRVSRPVKMQVYARPGYWTRQ